MVTLEKELPHDNLLTTLNSPLTTLSHPITQHSVKNVIRVKE